MKEKRSLRIVFLGTPEFAVASLDALNKSRHEVVAVITAPDKPAGRGKKLKGSAVKEYALKNELPLMQPTNLKNDAFQQELRSYRADIQTVVAFRMLPETVWDMPPMGTINLHGSLLPRYRGAAPIHWAVINGDKETGVTTFQLQHVIDTGDILLQERLSIGTDETTGEVHDRMMKIGAECLAKTIDQLADGIVKSKPQEELGINMITQAPKLYREMAQIDWKLDAQRVHNHIRGLSPFPAAWSVLKRKNHEDVMFKLLRSKLLGKAKGKSGEVSIDDGGLVVTCGDGKSIQVLELQMAGKRRMEVQEFLRGFNLNSGAFFESE